MFLKYLTKSPQFRYLRFLIVHRSRTSFENKLRAFAIISGLSGLVVLGLAIIAISKNWDLTDKWYFLCVGPLAVFSGFLIICWLKFDENRKSQTYKYLLPGFLTYILIVSFLQALGTGISVFMLFIPGLLLLAAVLYEIFDTAKIYYKNFTDDYAPKQVR